MALKRLHQFLISKCAYWTMSALFAAALFVGNGCEHEDELKDGEENMEKNSKAIIEEKKENKKQEKEKSKIGKELDYSPEDYQELHEEAIVVDAHNDTMMHIIDSKWLDPGDGSNWKPELDLGQDLSGVTRYGHIDLPKLKEGGIDVPYFASFVTEQFYPGRILDRNLALVNALYWTVDQNQGKMELAVSASEIEETVKRGNIAAVLTIEGGDAIQEPHGRELLHQFYDLGVRAFGLTWNNSNQLAEGVDSKYADGSFSHEGLTGYGKTIVQELQRLGIMIDVSHIHENSFWDIIELVEAPIIASHSSIDGVRKHPRNLTDLQLKALKENGGVVHITFVDSFLAEDEGKASVGKIVDHVDYAVDLIGIEHVGLGSDFDGAPMPEDLPDASAYPKITKELLERGYSGKEIKKILGGNALRAMREAEEIADLNDKWEAIKIIPDFNMGEIVEGRSPSLSASLQGKAVERKILNLNEIKELAKIIINGRVFSPEINRLSDREYEMLLATEEELLSSGFNVVTFAVEDDGGRHKRETKIIFCES